MKDRVNVIITIAGLEIQRALKCSFKDSAVSKIAVSARANKIWSRGNENFTGNKTAVTVADSSNLDCRTV